MVTLKFHYMRGHCVSAGRFELCGVYSYTGCVFGASLVCHSFGDPEPSAANMQGSIFVGCWSTTQQFCTEQIVRDGKPGTKTK